MIMQLLVFVSIVISCFVICSDILHVIVKQLFNNIQFLKLSRDYIYLYRVKIVIIRRMIIITFIECEDKINMLVV